MPLDPTTPVLVGVGQLTHRADDPADAIEPADLMAEALRRAETDSSGQGVLAAADTVLVPEMVSWRYANAPLAAAERVGARPRHTVYSTTGGNTPQMLVNLAARRIAAGDARVALLAGAEAVATRWKVRGSGIRLDWSAQPDDTTAPEAVGDSRPGSHEAEMARGLVVPVQVYPVLENALRAAAGVSIDDHQVRISELWARFSEVASANPHAWSGEARTAEEIRTPGPDNRMIAFPYPKLLCANIAVDQAAAVILCSVEAARALGVPRDRWVFPHAGTDANDHWFVSERASLTESPAIRIAGRRALDLASTSAGELAHVDLYSCFPAAVQIAATELGLALDRPLTVTGGLTFAGGPANNYVTHSIAAMVERLRAEPGTFGLCSALGWYVTKHAFGVYSTNPPAEGFRYANPQGEVDALPRRAVAATYHGPATVESYTVTYERDGQLGRGIVACLTPDGARAWGTTTEGAALKAMVVEEVCGRPATLHPDGTVEVG